MTLSVPLVEIWRGDMCESLHRGHGVICDDTGQIVQAWGDPGAVIYPRSSCKMVQALPLVLSGAADARGLGARHLALACASHEGAEIHTDAVQDWLHDLGLGASDLRCGPQAPRDRGAKWAMIRSGENPCRIHNNCSGKHCGFLTLSAHLGAGAEYHHIDHPVQRAIKDVFEDATAETSPRWAIDGCSAPNHATTMLGLSRAMARFAAADAGGNTWQQGAVRLRQAMLAHPDLVAGQGRACTELMQAAPGVVVKTGAEGVFVAILPDQKLGVAVKIEDGATRAAEAAIAAILIGQGALDANHPAALKRVNGPILNFAGETVGQTRPAQVLI